MEIVIIGTGNTAHMLGRLLREKGHLILQVYGRNKEEADNLSRLLNAQACHSLQDLNKNAQLFILAVTDQSVQNVAKELDVKETILVHTAGTVPISVLEGTALHYGVLYPLQSLKKGTPYMPEIPFLIDASDKDTLDIIRTLALDLSPTVKVAGDEERKKLHLAAVFVNNFVNHLYVLAEGFCIKEGLNFELLKPLIRETAARIDFFSPEIAQTGPAVRHDQSKIDNHLQMLEGHTGLYKIYQLLTESIGSRYGR